MCSDERLFLAVMNRDEIKAMLIFEILRNELKTF